MASGIITNLDNLVENIVQANVDVVAVNQAKIDAETAAVSAAEYKVEVETNVNLAKASALVASTKAEEAAESVIDAQAVIPQVADLRDLAQMHAEVAEVYKNQTFVKYSEFEEKYIGTYAMAPLIDPQGDPLVEGAMYWNTTVKKMYVWNGVKWDNTLEVAMIPELSFSIDSNGNLVVDTVGFAEDGEYIEWGTI